MAQQKVTKSEEEWRQQLTPEQYAVTREAATERPFTGAYLDSKEDGTYRCVACGAPLFSSDTKFDSGTGWPSFYDVMDNDAVELGEDRSYGMVRIEVVCSACDSHLGHLFDDGPEPTGRRFCINSCALDFEKSS